ncbi:MAG: DUF5317 family protein [Coriobacteriia bacterium]
MILFEVVLGFLLVSLLTGGSIRRLQQEKLRGEWLLLVLLPLQLSWSRLSVLLGLSCDVSLALWLIMMSTLVVVLAANARKRWMLAVAGLGIVLNVFVIGLNGGMPVSMRSVSEIGVSRDAAEVIMGDDCLHIVLDGETTLAALGDVIAVPGPDWCRAVVSLGDLLLAAGLGGWMFAAAKSHNA